MTQRLRYTIETLLVNALVLSTLYQLLVYLANRRFWRQTPLPPAEDAPSISAIVPLQGITLNTAAALHGLATTGPTDRYELLLVLESESDPAYPLAQEIAAAYPATARLVLSGPVGSHAPTLHQLHAGYQAAQGELIALVEPDVQVSAELWNAALAALTRPTLAAVFAPPLMLEPSPAPPNRYPTGGEMMLALHTNHARTAGLPLAALSGRGEMLVNGFMLFRRAALEQAGGFYHLLDESSPGSSLGRVLRENGQAVAMLPAPVHILPPRADFNQATAHLLRLLIVGRAYHPRPFLAWPFTNPLTVGFILGLITEREGRWWGRRTWWFFAVLRVALAYQLDRIRFRRGFTWAAYAQLFMYDTFISPLLWARALFSRTITWGERTYRVHQGGKATPLNGPNDRRAV
ncbi:MAG: glycosyltransferase [Chloroflexi bacterium]|nr:glycosyltransferase [Chloroflexota bacterium]